MFEMSHQPSFAIPEYAWKTNERFYLRDSHGWYVGQCNNDDGTFGMLERFSIETRLNAYQQPSTWVGREQLKQAELAAINQLPIMWWFMRFHHPIAGTWMVLQCQWTTHPLGNLHNGTGRTGV